MSTMIERVAKAIGIADLNACAKSMPNVPMETMAEYVKHAADEGHYEAMARAAIEAMKEPSDEMLRAMFEAMFEEKFDGTSAPMIGAGFEAAIQVALKETA